MLVSACAMCNIKKIKISQKGRRNFAIAPIRNQDSFEKTSYIKYILIYSDIFTLNNNLKRIQ